MTEPTHQITFNGHFRFKGTYDECHEWLHNKSKPMNVKTMLRTSAYKIEPIKELK